MFTWLSSKVSFFNPAKLESVKPIKKNPQSNDSSFMSYLSQGVSWIGSTIYLGAMPVSITGISKASQQLLFKMISLCIIAEKANANYVMNMTDPTNTTAYQYFINSDLLLQYDGGAEDINAFLEIPAACGAVLVKLLNGTFNLLHSASVSNVYDLSGYQTTVDNVASFYSITNATIQFLNDTATTFLWGPGNAEFENCMQEGMDAVGPVEPIEWAVVGEILGGVIGSIICIGGSCCLGMWALRKWDDRQIHKQLLEEDQAQQNYGTNDEEFEIDIDPETIGVKAEEYNPRSCCLII